MNLKIDYLYRDAANYKQYQTVIISNPEKHSPENVTHAIRSYFTAEQVWPEILHFRPEDLGWPTAYFDNHGEDEDDIYLHELEAIESTDKPAGNAFDLSLLCK